MDEFRGILVQACFQLTQAGSRTAQLLGQVGDLLLQVSNA